MRKHFKTIALAAVLATAAVAARPAEPAASDSQRTLTPIENEVRHELVMLPYLGVFDNLSFTVDGSTVTLAGQVYGATLRQSAEHVVSRIEAIETVVNEIEVLPISPHDDRIRLRMLRAVYGHPVLDGYALGAHPAIRIVVKNGNVTLEGVVDREMDRRVAGLQANSVPGVFSVTNNLQVASRDGS